MADENSTIGYSLERITSGNAGGFATSALLRDFITDEMISTNGGGGYAISKRTFDLLTTDEEIRSLIRSKLRG